MTTLRKHLEALTTPWRSSPRRIRELERKLARESENRVDCFMANARRMDKLERRIDQLLPRDAP